ncbi:hypothetical protein JYU34_007849 [Plutella xylostella]|uniref:Uncharacterized protein n=1 Tax=Plutella xylostella TaxID=51655 RepID=A0ABQ7QRE9_PLUXY|nr:hypothetical protein JYU34_007849 [Plutella xylostella]
MKSGGGGGGCSARPGVDKINSGSDIAPGSVLSHTYSPLFGGHKWRSGPRLAKMKPVSARIGRCAGALTTEAYLNGQLSIILGVTLEPCPAGCGRVPGSRPGLAQGGRGLARGGRGRRPRRFATPGSEDFANWL